MKEKDKCQSKRVREKVGRSPISATRSLHLLGVCSAKKPVFLSPRLRLFISRLSRTGYETGTRQDDVSRPKLVVVQ